MYYSLLEQGVLEDEILGYPLSTKIPPSTDAEAIGLIDLADELGWNAVYVVVPPLHKIRAFVSVVSAVVKAGYDLKVYNFPVAAKSWNEEVFHSATMPAARRADQIAGELAKMERYCKKGDHLTAEEILQYLDRRDAPASHPVGMMA